MTDMTNTEITEAFKQLVSIVKIHSESTSNHFAWAELGDAEKAIKALEEKQPIEAQIPDLSRLTRYDSDAQASHQALPEGVMREAGDGEYVRFDDVEILLSDWLEDLGESASPDSSGMSNSQIVEAIDNGIDRLLARSATNDSPVIERLRDAIEVLQARDSKVPNSHHGDLIESGRRLAMVADSLRAAGFEIIDTNQTASSSPESTGAPITWEERFTESVRLLTGQQPPESLVKAWISRENDDLQDWVGGTSLPWWLQNIGALDAAHVMADTPCEGDDANIDYSSPSSASQK